jgi:ATP-dependent DNA helicase RecG
MKLDVLSDALGRVLEGASANTLESEVLDFKRDPHTVTGRGAPGNPWARLVDEVEFAGVRLLVITVPEGLDLVTDGKGRAARRNGTECHPLTEDARRALAHERRNPDFTARISDLSWRDADPAAMNRARHLLSQLVDLRQQMADLDDRNLLRALNVLDRDDRLLVAGEVLFCPPGQDTLDVLLRTSAGAEPSVRRLREPLVQLLPRALELMRATIDPEVARIALMGGQEIALPDFSPIAVDEAVTNALVHRDYARPERVVLDHSPNALRVWSPGGLPFGVTEDRLLSTVSTPRNPALMAAMQQLGLAERASRGIDRMFREQIRVGQSVPAIRADEYSVEVYFSSGAPNRAFAGYVASLPRTLRENVDAVLVLLHLCQRPTVTPNEGANLLQISESEAKDRLGALAAGADALVERDGDSRRGVRWRLRPTVASALGTAVQHRARADSARPRVESHLKEYGWITNKTIRNMFDLDVQQATQILNDLRAANVVVKDPDGPQRGPAIRWLPADKPK